MKTCTIDENYTWQQNIFYFVTSAHEALPMSSKVRKDAATENVIN
jgi:hypothetical protein